MSEGKLTMVMQWEVNTERQYEGGLRARRYNDTMMEEFSKLITKGTLRKVNDWLTIHLTACQCIQIRLVKESFGVRRHSMKEIPVFIKSCNYHLSKKMADCLLGSQSAVSDRH
jgi:hypothetical protein